MCDVRDSDGHLVCRVESATGLVELVYDKMKANIVLPIGGSVQFHRNNVMTTILRTNECAFSVNRTKRSF